MALHIIGFLSFWGIIFLVTTTLVWLLKHEQLDNGGEDHGIIGTYLMLLKIVRRPAVQELIVVLLTVKVKLFLIILDKFICCHGDSSIFQIPWQFLLKENNIYLYAVVDTGHFGHPYTNLGDI